MSQCKRCGEEASDGYHTMEELYEHRFALWMAFCCIADEMADTEEALVADSKWPTPWMSRLHSDGSSYDGWFVLGMETRPGHQMTYHLPDKYWEKCIAFAPVRARAPEFDGHTSADVLNRIMEML